MTHPPEQSDNFSLEAFRRNLEHQSTFAEKQLEEFRQLPEEEQEAIARMLQKMAADTYLLEINIPRSLKDQIDNYAEGNSSIRTASDPFRAKVLMLLRAGLAAEDHSIK